MALKHIELPNKQYLLEVASILGHAIYFGREDIPTCKGCGLNIVTINDIQRRCSCPITCD